jgi:polysaccharide deacetylase 2 family uncharacterized protein YibQ
VAAVPTPEPAVPAARLAVVIDDWGYKRLPIQRLASMPGPLTLAVIPRLAHSREAAEAGAAAGFEVILHCPMQAKGGGHPEPDYLTVGLGTDEVRRRIGTDFESVPGAVGLNNHEGSLATEDRALMDAVAQVLKARGAYFLDSVTTPKSAIPAAAKAAGVPWAARRVFLDNVDRPAAIRGQLEEAAKIARRSGTCIAIGHPRKNTLDAVQDLLPAFRSSGVVLVKVSDLLHRP